MNSFCVTVVHAVVEHKRRCSSCGKEQTVEHLDQDECHHGKEYGQRFRKEELKASSLPRH